MVVVRFLLVKCEWLAKSCKINIVLNTTAIFAHNACGKKCNIIGEENIVIFWLVLLSFCIM
jgi:hypothetical protein